MDRVKLTEHDLNVIIEISQMITDYKHRVLQSHNWHKFQEYYLPRLVEQLATNTFVINNSANNVFLWLEDQITHSRRVAPGIKIKDAVPLQDLPLGQEALKICRLASRGHISYDSAQHNKKYQDLFPAE